MHSRAQNPTDVAVLRPVDSKDLELNMVKKDARVISVVYIILIVLGLGTGYLLSSKTELGTTKGAPIQSEKVVGVTDASTFKDCANGTLEKDGVNGEGTHHLVREGGPSQTVYLISSIVDLDQYVGLEVKVCGETQAAQQVSWLMDVGRLELLE
jgi:hypothetical protein